MEINDRIIYLIDNKANKSQKEFADAIGVTPQVISNIVQGRRTKPSYGVINAILSTFEDIDANWLLTGRGEMLREIALVSRENNRGRPFYNVDFTLGFKTSFDEDLTNPEFNIDFPPANHRNGFWTYGKGRSMLGEIESGDYVFLEEIEDFSWFPLGQIYGIVTDNKMRTIKRIVKSNDPDCYRLVSSNPDKINYPDQDIPKEKIFKLFLVKFVIKDLGE